MKILMVFTSHDQLGNTGRKTGFWLEEGAAPYFVFKDAGVELTLASPKGGQPPIDPKSDLPENQTPAQARFKKDEAAKKAFANTIKLAEAKAEDFDTVFYPGGHGPMWDLAESPVSKALLESFYNSGKPIALVCHSPGTLRHVTYKGEPLVKGKHVSGFTTVRLAVVVGQPSEKGPYTIRVKVPHGVKLMPHKHPEDRVYTVISGVFYIGLGDEFDADKLEAYPPGAVVVLPGNTSHFHWAKSGQYITQVTAIGPLGIEYVDSNDDPRTKKSRV
jgi:putative intracellular protease/amidase